MNLFEITCTTIVVGMSMVIIYKIIKTILEQADDR